jgi:flavin reductase (DIM6/NTAB) family NADH-FMN oxidoreductase RutF
MHTADRFASWVEAVDPAMIAVTAADGDEIDGCLVGFHSQASIRPLRYLVWLSLQNRTFRIATTAAVLGVHLLAVDQRDLAARLGTVTADDHPDKLRNIATRRHPSGAVLLADCPAWFAGRVLDRFPGGDHHGFLLEPIDVGEATTAAPLRLSAVSDLSAGHPADPTG